jgi:hypothetical protein
VTRTCLASLLSEPEGPGFTEGEQSGDVAGEGMHAAHLGLDSRAMVEVVLKCEFHGLWRIGRLAEVKALCPRPFLAKFRQTEMVRRPRHLGSQPWNGGPPLWVAIMEGHCRGRCGGLALAPNWHRSGVGGRHQGLARSRDAKSAAGLRHHPESLKVATAG